MQTFHITRQGRTFDYHELTDDHLQNIIQSHVSNAQAALQILSERNKYDVVLYESRVKNYLHEARCRGMQSDLMDTAYKYITICREHPITQQSNSEYKRRRAYCYTSDLYDEIELSDPFFYK